MVLTWARHTVAASWALQAEAESRCYTNQALCYLQLKQWRDAIYASTAALRLAGPCQQPKALCHRAHARLQRKEYKKALRDARAAQALLPSNRDVAQLVRRIHHEHAAKLKWQQRWRERCLAAVVGDGPSGNGGAAAAAGDDAMT